MALCLTFAGGYQPEKTNHIQMLFRDSYYNYVFLMIKIERMDFAGAPWSRSMIGSPACPREQESGPLFLAADGCFSIARLNKSTSIL